MNPKTKTNTYEFTEFSSVFTLAYLAIKVSDTDSVTDSNNLLPTVLIQRKYYHQLTMPNS